MIGKGVLSNISGERKAGSWVQWLAFAGLLVFATSATADEVTIAYIDAAAQEQTLTIDINSSLADYELAASLILEGANIIVTLDGKDDLEAIAAAVSAQAPDSMTSKSVSNTILGVGAALGGRAVRGSNDASVSNPPPATPPVSSPLSNIPPPTPPSGGTPPRPVPPAVLPPVASPN